MTSKQINRRALMQTLLLSVGATALGRVVMACSEPSPSTPEGPIFYRPKGPAPGPIPTDQEEQELGVSTPIDAGSEPPRVPNQVWESRAKQLDAEQQRLFGRAAFTRDDAGVMTGKETSHEPSITLVDEDGTTRVEVKVAHVMGTNKLDAGGAGDPGDAGKDASLTDAGDAARPDAGDAGPVDAGLAAVPDAAGAVVHYVTTIFLRAMVGDVETVVGLWELVSTDAAPPTVRFTIPAGVAVVTAYEWCTLHGLWKGPAVSL